MTSQTSSTSLPWPPTPSMAGVPPPTAARFRAPRPLSPSPSLIPGPSPPRGVPRDGPALPLAWEFLLAWRRRRPRGRRGLPVVARLWASLGGLAATLGCGEESRSSWAPRPALPHPQATAAPAAEDLPYPSSGRRRRPGATSDLRLGPAGQRRNRPPRHLSGGGAAGRRLPSAKAYPTKAPPTSHPPPPVHAVELLGRPS